LNGPQPFQGTEDEALANLNTHHFIACCDGEEFLDERCMDCDCKPWHVSAKYPCGTRVPRAELTPEQYLAAIAR
jgi:hypothetical protein